MHRLFIRKKYFFVLIVLIPILLFLIYGIKIGEMEGSVNEIFEIKDTKEIYNYKDSSIVTVMKHFMIVNPPEDLNELKRLVEAFTEDHPVEKETERSENKTRHFEVYFYRKSSKLPVDWKPNAAYFNTDRIEHHKNDCIAVIRWSDTKPNKNYNIMRKSSNKADYGKVIEEINYIDDKIVH